MNVVTGYLPVTVWMRFVPTQKARSAVTALKDSSAGTVFVWRSSSLASLITRTHTHTQKDVCTHWQTNLAAASHMSISLCRCSGERSVWGYPGWWGGGAAADVLRGGALCSGHTGCQGRFSLHICVHGSGGSHGWVLAFWQGRPFVRQLLKGTVRWKKLLQKGLQTFHVADAQMRVYLLGKASYSSCLDKIFCICLYFGQYTVSYWYVSVQKVQKEEPFFHIWSLVDEIQI